MYLIELSKNNHGLLLPWNYVYSKKYTDMKKPPGTWFLITNKWLFSKNKNEHRFFNEIKTF